MYSKEERPRGVRAKLVPSAYVPLRRWAAPGREKGTHDMIFHNSYYVILAKFFKHKFVRTISFFVKTMG